MIHDVELVVLITRVRLVRDPFRKYRESEVEVILLSQCVKSKAS